MSNQTEITGAIDLSVNVKQALTQIEHLEKGLGDVNDQIKDIIKHFDELNKKPLTNIEKQVNNYRTPKGKKTVTGSHGSMTSDTGREQDFKDYRKALKESEEAEKKLIEAKTKLAEEMEKDAAERKRLRQQEANSKTTLANAKKLAAEKAEDKTTDLYKSKEQAWIDLINGSKNMRAYREKHPELFATGGQYHSWRLQGARLASNLGGMASTLGVGGQILGGVLNTAAGVIRAPAAGLTAVFTNLAKAMLDLGKASTEAYAEIEAIKTQLGVVFSNQTQADSMFGEIAHYAVKSPFGVQQTSEMAVLLKQSGVYASDLMNTLKMIGDTAGGNMEKMKRIANNYAQIVSIGKASMLDMRQFAYAGIPIFEAVSKELGVSQQELRKLISDGKVTSDIIEKVFKDLTGINGIFENATEKGAKTLKARLQNLADARQLAFGEIGEGLVNIGANAGEDSYVVKGVTWLENIYTLLNERIDKKNTREEEEDIIALEQRKQTLERLIKTTEDENLKSYFETKLKELENKISNEKVSAAFVHSYDLKTREHNAYLKANNLDYYSSETAKLEMEKFYKDYKDFIEAAMIIDNTFKDQEDKSLLRLARNKYLKENPGKTTSDADEYLRVIGEQYRKLVDIYNNAQLAETVTGREKDEARNRNVLQSQSDLANSINKNSDSAQSLSHTFMEIRNKQSELKSTQEALKKTEEERIEEGVKILNALKAMTNPDGTIQLKDLSYENLDSFLEYVRRGAFDVEGRLSTNYDENNEMLEYEKYDLKNNYGKSLSFINRLLLERKSDPNIYDGNTEGLKKLEALVELLNQDEFKLKNLDVSDTKRFYERYNSGYDILSRRLEKVISSVTTEEEKAFYQRLKDILGFSNLRLGTNLTGWDYKPEPEEEKKGNADIFIPLWKRIFSSATGLSTTGMTSTVQTLSNYRDDMAIRNMTADVLRATMRTMGVDSAMGLMRVSSAETLAGDNGKTLQADWLATRKVIKDFATQLSASTEVIAAYRKGLEAELDVYEQLIAAGYTQAESTDLGSQKFVSTKQLAKLELGNSSQLVNAFGEVLQTASGKKYSVEDIKFVNGELYDNLGNKIEEEVVVTGNLFEFIKGEMPRLRSELHEANVAELNNNLMKQLYDKAATNSYMQRYLENNGYNVNTALALQNPEYISKYLDSKMTELKASNSNLASLSNSDIYMTAMAYQKRSADIKKEIEEIQKDIDNTPSLERQRIMANGYDERVSHIYLLESELENLKEYVNIANEAFRAMDSDLGKITSNENAQAVFEKIGRQNIDEAVLKAYLLNSQRNIWGLTDPNNLKPRDYGGLRGSRNLIQGMFAGEDIAFDREDFIAETMRANKEKYGLSESDLNKTNAELAKMLSLSEQIAITWDKGGNDVAASLEKLAYSIGSTLSQFTGTALTSTFETWGQAIGEGADASDKLEENFRKLGASLSSNLGTMITEAGLSMAIHASSGAEVFAGLGLAALGGAASWLGGYLGAKTSSKNETDSEAKRIESLTDQLKELLAQARADALYYEKNLRHKTALGLNEQFSYKSVNDAIITKKGDVIKTSPEDYLIATKTPQALGNNTVVQPVINFSVVDNVGVKVRQEQKQNPDGSIDFRTIIENAVGEYIASPKSDDAFNARQYRLNGRTSIM